MKTIKLIGCFTLGAMVLASCSKEVQIEKKLTRGDGEWNVDEVSWAKAEVSSQINAGVGTDYNAGTFIFNDDGTGSYDFTIDGDRRQRTFTWSNTGSEIRIVADVTLNLFKADVFTMIVVENKKGKQVWELAETLVDFTGVYAIEATLRLSKK